MFRIRKSIPLLAKDRQSSGHADLHWMLGVPTVHDQQHLKVIQDRLRSFKQVNQKIAVSCKQ